MEQQYTKVFEYINNVISILDEPEKFEKCDFSILCDKYPIQTNKNMYLAKVLYISLKSKKDVCRLYPDKIQENNLEHVILTTNSRRRLSDKMNEFFVNGSNEEQFYEEHSFYNYSVELANKMTKDIIIKLREKYNLTTPSIFIGTSQPLVLE